MNKALRNRRRMKILVAVAGAFWSAPAWAQFSFDAAANTALADLPAGVAAGDWDGDEDSDLAIAAENVDRVAVYFNNGDGTFGVPVDVPTGAGTGPGYVAAADLDGDTDLDLAVALQNSNTVLVLLNNGAGTFSSSGSFAVDQNPRSIAAGQLDGDTDVDLAVVNRDSNNVSILLNNGNATFAAATNVAVGADPRAVASGDLDNDTDVDLAVTNHDDRTVSILSNNGTGGFTVSTTLSVGADLRPDGIDAGDLDGDSDVDLAVATSGNGLNVASIFTNDGVGAFSGPVNYPVGGVNPGRLLLSDLDCDGDPDVVTLNVDSGDVSLLPNAGDATFGAATLLTVGTSPDHAAAEDLDGDRVSDLVVTNRDSNNFSLLFNNSAIPADGDAEDDGDRDLRDFASLQICFSGPNSGPSFLAPGPTCLNNFDFDCDGDIDLDDHTAFVDLLSGP